MHTTEILAMEMIDKMSPILTEVSTVISVRSVVVILTFIAGASVGFAFMWWGLRKAVSALMSAFRKGKVSL